MKKILSIKDFVPCIPWSQIERHFGKREYKKFHKWMFGQTCVKEGVYIGDLESYIEQRNRNIKDPYVWD